MTEHVELAREDGPRGEVVLRERHDADGAPPVLELRVNGVFVMDTLETTSEEQLATVALGAVDTPTRVLVGGLGFGYTAHAVLGDGRVEHLVVVEVEEALVGWMRDGTVPHGPAYLADERLTLVTADIRTAVTEAAPASYDLVLLDVDNGPGQLVHEANAEVYGIGFLGAVAGVLRPGGVVAVWSAAEAPGLAESLAAVYGAAVPIPTDVRLQDRDERYWLYLARRGADRPDGVGAGSVGSLGVMDSYRTEHDSMGEIQVPEDALWRAQTQRAVENFPISGSVLEAEHVKAIARVKAAAATVNADLGVVSPEQAKAIQAAAAEIVDGRHLDEFPIDVFQTGSGTSSNMNMNEVLASLAQRAGVDVHPNDHVNASQSSNDTFPTSIHVAATSATVQQLVPALDHLASTLEAKAEEFSETVKSGRTHLMDATPVMLGQELGGYAAAMRYGIERLEAALPRVAELPLGGTAVGTGINTPPGFAAKVIAELADATGLPFTEARNHFEAQGARDALVELSGQLRTIAVGLTKICNDLRWMSSGPRTGLAEINLPDLQPGSSIMPGKVNPVLPEATLMVCAQVIGNDTTVTVSGASGNFELNVMMPVLARNLLESIRLLSTSSRLLADRCVAGITANVDRMRTYAESSPSVVTPLNRYIGYENAAKVAKKALAEERTIKDVVVEMGFVDDGSLTAEQLDAALDVASMTHP